MTTSAELFGDQHVQRYIETDGEEGFEWRNGTKILVLFTKGRKSGQERANALIFEPDGDDYLIVASKGGTDAPPAWFVNLEADPDAVEVQVKGDRFKARPRIAELHGGQLTARDRDEGGTELIIALGPPAAGV